MMCTNVSMWGAVYWTPEMVTECKCEIETIEEEKMEMVCTQGSFNNYVDRSLSFFDTPTPLRGQFLYPEHGQKWTFFDPLPPHLANLVIE